MCEKNSKTQNSEVYFRNTRQYKQYSYQQELTVRSALKIRWTWLTSGAHVPL